MRQGEEESVCALVEKVFNEFVAPDYDLDGVNEFFKFANPSALAGRAGTEQVVMVAEKGRDLVGIIEIRNRSHIAMLFVSRRGKGIAKELIRRAVNECRERLPDLKRITVNSSPYAENVYSRMGFKATGPVRKQNGILFVPMACDLDRPGHWNAGSDRDDEIRPLADGCLRRIEVIEMNPDAIRAKFGDDYAADDRTFLMGIDRRFTAHMAARFRGRNVLETCTGAGFTTIALARVASRVTTVEIDPHHQAQAEKNVQKAGLSDSVTFISGDVLDRNLLAGLPPFDAAFLDPDWAITGPDHVYRFVHSNTQPPADALLERIFELTRNVAIVLPPLLDTRELAGLPPNERQKLFLGESHELYCLYFGELAAGFGETIFRVLT
jgi:GNAT superfamily N-acetyltransferase